MAVKTQIPGPHAIAATKRRTFRTFLLMEQFAAAEIGARIRDARLAAGFTQADLAELASFSKRSLQDYETGVTLPYRHLREIGRLLDKPTEWFLYGDTVTESVAAGEDRLARVEARLDEALVLLRDLRGHEDAGSNAAEG